MPGTTHKSMEVYDGTPSGAAGQALDNNFVAIADRIGNYIENAGDPDANDDDQDTGGNGVAYQNSLWLNTTDKTLWLCIDATSTAAVWKHVNMVDIVLDTSPQLGGNLDGNTFDINTSGALGIGGAATITGNIVSTTGNIYVDSDDKSLILGESADYSIQWDGDDAVHTISAGDFVFTGGNFGIGTVSPNAPLEVKGAKPGGNVGGFQSGMFHVTGSGTAQFSNSVITGHSAYNTNTQLWYLGSLSDSNNVIGFLNRQNADIHFYTNNTFRMAIDAAGNVGIGTTSPHYPLTVDGGIGGLEKSADPAEPAEGEYVIWMSDGTSNQTGVADGDVIIASKAGGITKVTILHDHSAAGAWV